MIKIKIEVTFKGKVEIQKYKNHRWFNLIQQIIKTEEEESVSVCVLLMEIFASNGQAAKAVHLPDYQPWREGKEKERERERERYTRINFMCNVTRQRKALKQYTLKHKKTNNNNDNVQMKIWEK